MPTERFEVTLSGPAASEIAKRVRGLPGARGSRVEADAAGLVIFEGEPEKAVHFWSALAECCVGRNVGMRVGSVDLDPRRPGLVPPGCGPWYVVPESRADMQRCFRAFLLNAFQIHGFRMEPEVKGAEQAMARDLPGGRQTLVLQEGASCSLQGWFCINACAELEFSEGPPRVVASVRLPNPRSDCSEKAWFQLNQGNVLQTFDRATCMIDELGIPLLDRMGTIQGLQSLLLDRPEDAHVSLGGVSPITMLLQRDSPEMAAAYLEREVTDRRYPQGTIDLLTMIHDKAKAAAYIEGLRAELAKIAKAVAETPIERGEARLQSMAAGIDEIAAAVKEALRRR